MRGRYHYAIRDLPKNLCRTIAYYFYILCLDIEDYKHLNYCLDLYNALVKALNLQDHSKQIKKNSRKTPAKSQQKFYMDS